MCSAFRDLAKELAEEKAKELAGKRAEEMALRLLARGKMTEEEIAEDTGLPLEAVRELARLQPV